MKTRKIKATLAVALVAAAGLCSYGTYQDYKADKESNLVMLNIEALTEDDVSGEWYLHHFECDPYLITEAQVKKLMGFLSIVTVKGNLYADFSSITQYFNHNSAGGEGPCEKAAQKTCYDACLELVALLNK